MKTVDVGRLGEKLAAKYLKKQRYKVIETNVHASHNEIDIIAKNKEYIVFVEVKARTTDSTMDMHFGTPASAVTYSKQHRTVEAARQYLKRGKYKDLQPRFDVIEVYLEKSTYSVLDINHIVNAFGA